MKTRICLSLILALFLFACAASEDSARGQFSAPIDEQVSRVRGWDYIAKKLTADGITEQTIVSTLGNPRMPLYENIPFTLAPKESTQIYSQFTSKKNIKLIQSLYADYAQAFEAAESKYHVDRGVIAAILFVESRFGQFVGKELAVNRIARVSSVAEPENITWNYDRLRKDDPSVTKKQVADRAAYLESTFYPELLALMKMAQLKKVDILTVKGSSAGAIGIPQFLPSSYLKYGVDGNNDGTVSLFQMDDAIYSVGNYLSTNGWPQQGTRAEKKKALWNYNKSSPYGDAILDVAKEVE